MFFTWIARTPILFILNTDNMKIAIITSGILPVPAVQGGAVENLIDFYLDYNNRNKLHDITVYSVFNTSVESHPALKSKVNHYKYIKTESYLYRFRRKIYSYFNKGVYDYFIEFFFDNVCKQIKKTHYDVIILENRPGYAVKLSRKTSTPIIAHIHFDFFSSSQSEILFERIKGIISVSNFLYSKTSDRIKNKCITVYNGIDLSKFTIMSNQARRIKRNHFLFKENEIILIYTGRISPIKGVKELIEAITLLNDKNIKLLIVGSPQFGKIEARDEYTDSVYKIASHIKDQIIFTGYIPYSDIPNLYSISDIAIIPSICNDAFPTSTLEAMATGLPLIVSNRGGLPEQVDTENAILINTDKDFIINLAKAIHYLSYNESLRIKMGCESLRKSKKFEKDVFSINFFSAVEHFI